MPKLVLKAGSRPPWVGLAAAIWVQVSAGNSYNFPLYSSALKSVLGYNQKQVTMLGVANDIGESVGLLPGIACNKFPPWAVLLVGVVCCFLGYGVIWLAISETVANLPYWLLFITLVVATNSCAWLGTAVLVTNMRNFPLSRGTVAGILKGYIGVSAAVYTVLYSFVLKYSAVHLLLFLTIGIPILCLAMLYFVRPCTPACGEDSSEHVHFIFTQAASIVLAVYLLTVTIIHHLVSLSSAVTYSLVAVAILLMLSPLAIPVKMTLFPTNSKKPAPRVDSSEPLVSEEGDSSQREPLLTPSSSAANLESFHEGDDASDMETLLAVGEGAVKKKRRPKRGEDFMIREALIKADFWLLWFAYFFGVGPGVTVINNFSQIGASLGVSDTTILLAVFSFCNFAGRIGSGAVSEYFVRSRAIPRTFWMMCSHIVMAIAFILYASSLSGTVYAATALLGFCYGVLYAMMVPVASEIFGLKHVGVIYNFVQLGNPIGALLFSAMLAGSLYDAEAAEQGSATCKGIECFRITFLVLAGMCGLGTILSIILTVRIRPVYRMLYGSGSFRMPEVSGH